MSIETSFLIINSEHSFLYERAQYPFVSRLGTSVGANDHGHTAKYWEQRYSQKDTSWHLDQVHPSLVKHIGELTDGESGEFKRIFVPLCGKSHDIAYLLSLGHSVFAVEFLLQPILELKAENSFKFKYNPDESIYSAEEGRLQIYHGDLFNCPIEKYGPFDCVWDRASFVAMDYNMRQTYVDVLKRSLQNADKTYHQFNYLLHTVMYDKNLLKGPPNSVLIEDMERFYGGWAHVKLVDKFSKNLESPSGQVSGESDKSPDVYEVVYVIGPKASPSQAEK